MTNDGPTAEARMERDLMDAFGDRIRIDDAFACRVWCALSNVHWHHAEAGTLSLTFRMAGDLIASIRGSGDYMDWYCCGQAGVVTPEIAEALSNRGWRFDGEIGEPRLDFHGA